MVMFVSGGDYPHLTYYETTYSYVNEADISLIIEDVICTTGEQTGHIKYYDNSDRTFSKAVFSVDLALLSDR